nr:MAG TPA: Kita-kyushu lung cancer antigen 1 [Caudoviricetes sp.]
MFHPHLITTVRGMSRDILFSFPSSLLMKAAPRLS